MNSIEMGSRNHRDLAQGGRTPGIAHHNQPWYEAYMSALFEPDIERIAERIFEAEQLIIARERAISGEAFKGAEHVALKRALHALHALQCCLNPEQ